MITSELKSIIHRTQQIFFLFYALFHSLYTLLKSLTKELRWENDVISSKKWRHLT